MLEFGGVALVAAVVTFVSCAVVLRLARRRGLVLEVRARDVHKTPTPRLGGIAMYLGLVASFAVAALVPQLREGIHNAPVVLALMGAATLITVVGVLDDLYDLDWMIKLAAQLLAAGVLALQGVQILSVPLGNTLLVASPTVNLVLTVVLMVAVMNAANFIDGMDGLLAGFALISSGCFFVYTRILAAQTGQSSAVLLATLITAVIFGVCLGFLPFNWHVAKLFMGDAGALLLGLLLATSTISVTGQLNPAALNQSVVLASYIPIILPLALLALPLLDMTLAVIRRTAAGQSPFSTADRKHLHHRLLDYGHSHTQVVFIFYLWTLTMALACLLVFVVESYLVPALVLVGGSLACLAVTLVPAQVFRDWLRRRGLWVSRAGRAKIAKSRETESK